MFLIILLLMLCLNISKLIFLFDICLVCFLFVSCYLFVGMWEFFHIVYFTKSDLKREHLVLETCLLSNYFLFGHHKICDSLYILFYTVCSLFRCVGICFVENHICVSNVCNQLQKPCEFVKITQDDLNGIKIVIKTGILTSNRKPQM